VRCVRAALYLRLSSPPAASKWSCVSMTASIDLTPSRGNHSYLNRRSEGGGEREMEDIERGVSAYLRFLCHFHPTQNMFSPPSLYHCHPPPTHNGTLPKELSAVDQYVLLLAFAPALSTLTTAKSEEEAGIAPPIFRVRPQAVHACPTGGGRAGDAANARYALLRCECCAHTRVRAAKRKERWGGWKERLAG